MRVTKAEVIKTASDMADRNGLHNVSLKAIAENLGIRTPSLYNHIGSLDELLREIAHSGMRTMNEKMIRAAIGKTGDSALKLVAVEYLNYMIEHPGVYEIIQWASWNGTEETAIIFNDYLSLLKTLICSCGFNPDKTTEILSMVTGMLHGYTTLQLRYAFSNPDKVRKELQIENNFVIGHIGRFNLQKNHKFILEIFKRILQKEKDTVLLLAGNGELEEDIKKMARELKIESNVRFLGVRKDIERLYQAMDIFLMPSLFEGLPLTGVEAQASNIKCFFSDTITKEVIITDNTKFISLNESAEKWAKEILENRVYDRENVKIINEEFDIRKLAKKMQKKYIEYNERKFKE